jgi:hypothetical protein
VSFSDYMASLGANKQNLTGVFNPGPNYGMEGTGALAGAFKAPYQVGQQAEIWGRPDPNQKFLLPYNTAIGTPTDPRIHMGANGGLRKGYAEGYVDSSGGFLGYGSNYDQLQQGGGVLNNRYADYAANEPVKLQQLETQRLANEQAALNLQRQRAAARQQNVPQFTGGGLMGLGQGQGPQTQRAPQARQVQGMHRGGAQGLLGGGLHRGTGPTGGGQ